MTSGQNFRRVEKCLFYISKWKKQDIKSWMFITIDFLRNNLHIFEYVKTYEKVQKYHSSFLPASSSDSSLPIKTVFLNA